MSSKQRVFSHDNTINYIDYLNNKTGEEALKTLKNSDPENIIKNYKSYDQKINYSKAYFKHFYCENDIYIPIEINCEPCTKIKKTDSHLIYSSKKHCLNQTTNNIYKSNISYKKFETLKDPCKKCNVNNYKQCNDCKLKNHTLYPYGTYKSHKSEPLFLKKQLDLRCWDPCIKKCPIPFEILNKSDYNCSIKLKTNGKLIKPLFVN
jgi:hypothetical protein